MTIGEQIKVARLKKDWTQEELSHLLNVSRPTVSSWEVGKNYPDLETIISISDLFAISLDELLREDHEMTKKMARKIKMSHYYQLLLMSIGVLVISYLSFYGLAKALETKQLTNLEKNQWQQLNERENEGKYLKKYEIIEGDLDYYTSVILTPLGGNPLKNHRLKIITRKNKLVMTVRDKDTIELTITKSNDPEVHNTLKVKVNDKLELSDKIGDNRPLLSQSANDLVIDYIEKNRNDYQEMIDKTLIKMQALN